MGASNIGYLLSSVCYNGSVDASKRDAFIDLPCSEFYAYHHLLELVIKPVAVLLEDQRSKASCERNIKAYLLLIDCSRFRYFPEFVLYQNRSSKEKSSLILNDF